jgi:hypothetical protein
VIPLIWAEGDRCLIRGEIGIISAISGQDCCVHLTGHRLIFCQLPELELVPPSSVERDERDTDPAPPDDELTDVEIPKAPPPVSVDEYRTLPIWLGCPESEE